MNQGESGRTPSSARQNRRKFLRTVAVSTALASLGAFGARAQAQQRKKLVLVGHQVHQTVAKGAGGKGKDLIAAFEQSHDVDVTYHTYPNPETHEKLFRIGPLSRTEEDVFHVLDPWAIPVLTKFFVPLDPYLQSKPIAGWPEDWPKPMVKLGTLEGKVYLMPVRAGCWGLWYNRRIFKERGIAAPPKTAEEIYDIAKACTFTRPDGEKIYGWSSRATIGDLYEPLVITVRMWGGDNADLITPNFKIALTEPPVLQAVELWQRMFKDGIMPPDMFTYSYAQNVKMFQEGRVALTVEPTNYWPTFNDSKASKIAGDAVPGVLPISKALRHPRGFSSGTLFLWFQGILRGSQRKDLAWEYIRHLATRESHREMAKSGNPPPRLSVLSDPEYIKSDPGGDITIKQIAVARTPLPPFPKVSQAVDIIGEHVQNVVVRGGSVKDEMAKATERIKPLLP